MTHVYFNWLTVKKQIKEMISIDHIFHIVQAVLCFFLILYFILQVKF